MSPEPRAHRPQVPPSGPSISEPSEARARPRPAPPREERPPLSWSKVTGFGVSGGLLVAGIIAAVSALLR